MGDASDEIDFENLIDLFESSFLEDDTTGFNDEKIEKKLKVHSIRNISIHMILCILMRILKRNQDLKSHKLIFRLIEVTKSPELQSFHIFQQSVQI